MSLAEVTTNIEFVVWDKDIVGKDYLGEITANLASCFKDDKYDFENDALDVRNSFLVPMVSRFMKLLYRISSWTSPQLVQKLRLRDRSESKLVSSSIQTIRRMSGSQKYIRNSCDDKKLLRSAFLLLPRYDS